MFGLTQTVWKETERQKKKKGWTASSESSQRMNYVLDEGGAGWWEGLRLRCPLPAHWFDISITDSKGDHDSWAVGSQLFSCFENIGMCSQVEGLLGDY